MPSLPSLDSHPSPAPEDNLRQLPRPRQYHTSSHPGTAGPSSAHSPTYTRNNSTSQTKASVTKHSKIRRRSFTALVLFPPCTLAMVFLFPLILFLAAPAMYLAAWVVFWNMASPSSLSAMPLHPRKIWKLNKAIFGVIFSNLALLPVGISLIKYRYFTMRGSTKSSGLLTDIPYTSAKSSNKLDIYIPDSTVRVMDSRSFRLNSSSNEQLKLRPVVVFIYGGGWATGTKWMYTLVGARLREMGYVVFLPEYSVYPATIQNMEYEVRSAIQWTHSHCSEFGGDPNRMYLMGHSAGAHLCVLSVLNDCIKRTPVSLLGGPAVVSNSPVLSSLLKETNTVGTLPRLRGMMLYSGVYDIGEHYKHESMRGVEELSVMARLMGGTETSFRLWSPKYVLKELIQVTSMIDSTHPNESQATRLDFLQHLKSLLPLETLIIHGDKDATVPLKSSVELFEETKALNLGGSVRFQMLAGMGHEEPVVAIMPSMARQNKYTKPLILGIQQFIEGGSSQTL